MAKMKILKRLKSLEKKTKHAPKPGQVTFEQIIKHPKVKAYLDEADHYLGLLGFTKHGVTHALRCAVQSKLILLELGINSREAEMAAIIGYLHDMGNAVNREHHEFASALLAKDILDEVNCDPKEQAKIISAIGNHHETTGIPTSLAGAATIIADKCQVHRARVRAKKRTQFDIHDRVNYTVTESHVRVDKRKKIIRFDIKIDNTTANILEYFEIFMDRMLICQKAASFLGCKFELVINRTKVA